MTKIKMNQLKVPPPVLVAHRGYSGQYPENTLLSYKKAYKHGARYMELDLQMTKDLVPLLHHDVSLQRMAGVDVDIRTLKAKEVKKFRGSYPGHFGDKFSDNKFTSFKKMCWWLKIHPDVTLFIEFKKESIDTFGLSTFIDAVYELVREHKVEAQCVFISFDFEVASYTQKNYSLQMGVVLPKWHQKHLSAIKELNPDFVFCDKNFLPEKDKDIWQGDWQWAIYNLDDADSAIEMANRGIPFLETNEIGLLMQNQELANV